MVKNWTETVKKEPNLKEELNPDQLKDEFMADWKENVKKRRMNEQAIKVMTSCSRFLV